MKNLLKISFVIMISFVTLMSFTFFQTSDKYDVSRFFKPTGYMGDGEFGGKYVKLLKACKEQPYSGPYCIRVDYTIGPKGWAGIYWQNEPDNWCKEPGNDMSDNGYDSITFVARGKNGGEMVEFKAGGIKDCGKYKDSFEVTLGEIILTEDWTEYSISLEGENLKSVIGGFCWVASGHSNPKGLTFYIDDIFYE